MVLDGEKVSDGGEYAMVCGIKYHVTPPADPWQGWTGDHIDFKYSILGQSLMWFKQDGIFHLDIHIVSFGLKNGLHSK